jgi:predicted AAA+ superfamily ATPase
MERTLYKELLAWKTGPHHKPLLLMGARQTGKTWLADQFIRQEYAESTQVNLLDDTEITELYDTSLSAQDKYLALKAIVGKDFEGPDKVLFIDEVQESESLISALKFFREKHPELNIICSGSLLGVRLKRFSKSFPVGQITLLDLYPLDMREFLLAFDEDLLIAEVERCFETDTPLVKPLHERALRYYLLYLCVGGMPEAVRSCVDAQKDLTRFDEGILDAIVTAYFDDMNRYVSNNSEALRIERAYRSIPIQLSNRANKFQYAKIARSARAKDYETALDWLFASGLCYSSHKVTRPYMPLRGNEDVRAFKLFLNDVGLLRSQLKVPFSNLITNSAFDLKGAMVENHVAVHLRSKGLDLHYWESEHSAEVDFLLQTADGIVPVEVKAGDNVRSKSLNVYREKYRPPYAVRVSSKNFGFENGIKSVPLYAVFCL